MPSRLNEPVFVISVAARLVEMHPQTLRKYEREGLIVPSRTQGNLRLYSDRDIERLRQVKYLVDGVGLNLAGVELALDLTRRIRELRGTVGSMARTGQRDAETDKGCDHGGDLANIHRELDHILAMLGHIDERPQDR